MISYTIENKRQYRYPQRGVLGRPELDHVDRGCDAFRHTLIDQGLTRGEVVPTWVYSMQERGWYIQFTYGEQVPVEPSK